jgi:ParB/RepB/Spo0J family partition protein
MEGCHYEIITLKTLSAETPYCLRYKVEDAALAKSIAKRGVLTPVLLAKCQDKSQQIVVGHRRVQAARENGLEKIGAFILNENCAPKELFLFSILSNWNQHWTELDQSWTLHKAVKDFGFKEEEILEEILPALGLAAHRGLLERYLKIASLHPALLNLLAEGKLPFRGAHLLAQLQKEDQQEFAQTIASQAALTANESIQITEYLLDLLKIRGGGLKTLLQEEEIQTVLNQPEWSLQQKAHHLGRVLHKMRFPQLQGYESKFKTIASELARECQDLSLEAPSYFEEEGFLMRAKIRNAEALERLLGHLQHRKKLLNSLFDIKL